MYTYLYMIHMYNTHHDRTNELRPSPPSSIYVYIYINTYIYLYLHICIYIYAYISIWNTYIQYTHIIIAPPDDA